MLLQESQKETRQTPINISNIKAKPPVWQQSRSCSKARKVGAKFNIGETAIQRNVKNFIMHKKIQVCCISIE